MPRSKLLLTVPQAAKRLGISKQSVYVAIKRGRLPVEIVQIQRQKIPEAAVEAFRVHPRWREAAAKRAS